MNKNEMTYWYTLALMPTIWTRRKNEIYVKCFNHHPQISIIELFENQDNWDDLGLSDDEKNAFRNAHNDLPNNSFVVEDLLSQGYNILPVHGDNYPKTLKENLGVTSPTVIFTKGDISLLNSPTIAIVGSRNAMPISLTFTDNVARKATQKKRIVVSGFAKGVDRQALDSALISGGKSIIVLPQGIQTFEAGFREYYKYLAQGKLLVMSTFAPKAPWTKEFAMMRNPIIYGLASEVYVAQSDEKGGTWSGAIDGLRKKRPIYVRWPETEEENANILLAQKGAQPVDIQGNPVALSPDLLKTDEQKKLDEINAKINQILSSGGKISSKEMLKQLAFDWSDAKMKKHLDSLPFANKIKEKNRIYYCKKDAPCKTLF